MLWLIFFLTFLTFFYIKIVKPHKYWLERHVPHKKPNVLFGNMAPIIFRKTSLTEHLHSLCKEFQNERYFGFYQFLNPTLMINNPELIKQIGIKDFEYFMDHRSIIDEKLDPMFGKNLLLLKGQRWKQMRSRLTPAFTSCKMKNMFSLISESTEQFTNYFQKNHDSNKQVTVEMKDLFTRFANDTIAICAFGLKCDSLSQRDNEFYNSGKKITEFTLRRNLTFFGYSMFPFLMKLLKVRFINKETVDYFKNLVISTMNYREENKIFKPDLIDILIQTRKGNLRNEATSQFTEETDVQFKIISELEMLSQNQQNSSKLTDDDLTAQALIFFFGGFDTTSTVMCHVANELAFNPNIQEKLQEEIDNTLKTSNGVISYEIINKMKYLDMVIWETLRKWPPLIISDRICTKPYRIQPTKPHEKPLNLNIGDHIWIMQYSLHRNPKYFPDPDKFDPERFRDENKDNIVSGSYIPFGIGPRNCIASRFGFLVVKTLFCHLLSKFDIVVDDKTEIPFKLSKVNFNLLSDSGFWLALRPRKIA